MDVGIEMFAKCTNSVTNACERWVLGEDAIGEANKCATSLRTVVERLRPVHSYLDLAQLEKEQEAFQHTVSLSQFVAEALRKDSNSLPATVELLKAPADASPLANAAMHFAEVVNTNHNAFYTLSRSV